MTLVTESFLIFSLPQSILVILWSKIWFQNCFFSLQKSSASKRPLVKIHHCLV